MRKVRERDIQDLIELICYKHEVKFPAYTDACIHIDTNTVYITVDMIIEPKSLDKVIAFEYSKEIEKATLGNLKLIDQEYKYSGQNISVRMYFSNGYDAIT